MRRLLIASFALMLTACDSKAPDPKASGPNPAPVGGAQAALDLPKGELTYHFGASDSQTTIRFESKTSVTNILGKSTRIEPFSASGRFRSSSLQRRPCNLSNETVSISRATSILISEASSSRRTQRLRSPSIIC